MANKQAHHYLKKYDNNTLSTIFDWKTGLYGWDENNYPLKLQFDWYWLFANPLM